MGQPFNIKDFGTLTRSRLALAFVSSCPEPLTSVEFFWFCKLAQKAAQYNILPYSCVLTHAMHVGSPWQQNDCNDSQIFLRKIRESKMESPTFGKTALIHQTKEILTSKPIVTQGVSEKLLKNGEHKSLPEHTFIWRLA